MERNGIFDVNNNVLMWPVKFKYSFGVYTSLPSSLSSYYSFVYLSCLEEKERILTPKNLILQQSHLSNIGKTIQHQHVSYIESIYVPALTIVHFRKEQGPQDHYVQTVAKGVQSPNCKLCPKSFAMMLLKRKKPPMFCKTSLSTPWHQQKR